MKSFNKHLDFFLTVGSTDNTAFPYTISTVSDAPMKGEYYPPDALSFIIRTDEDGQPWSRDGYLTIDCETDADSTLVIFYTFFHGDEQLAQTNTRTVGSRRVKNSIALRFLDSSTAFPPMLPGRLKCMTGGKPTCIDEIDRIEVRVKATKHFKKMILHDLFVSDTLPDLTVQGAPMVDRYGQNIDRDWPEKICSDRQLRNYLTGEFEAAQKAQGYDRDDYDEFGGWKKLQFEAKGHFYPHFDGKRFWLADPLGNAFFSNGFCYGNRTGIYGLVDTMAPLFSELPKVDDPQFRDAWTTAASVPEYVKRNGLDASRGVRLFNFARANMIRVFGESWFDAWVTINTARMKHWGFNTIAVGVNNYDDERTEEFLKKAKMPYCITLKEFPKTQTLIFRDFPDVFSEQYHAMCRAYAAQLRPYADDPYFIGYFMTNEPEWWFASKNVNIAERVFAHETTSATRAFLIGRLREKYGNIGTLNRMWKTDFRDFYDLNRPLPYLDKTSAAAAEDLTIFKKLLLSEYCRVPSEAIRAVAPNSLNMGMRYGGVNVGGDGLDVADCFDVFSFNCYGAEPSKKLNAVSSVLHKPLIVGEWHYGTLERGMLSNGAVGCVTQADRGTACANYMLSAFENPNCVGVHYFEFNDQPLLGRFDGENQQIGMIDVCNRPYDACVERFAVINREMYDLLCGTKSRQKQPWARELKY